MNTEELIRAKIQDHKREIADLEEALGEIRGGDGEPPAIPMPEFLAAEANVDHEWLVGGLIGQGATGMLVADPHVGKSTLAIQLCLAAASGHNTLGWRIAKPRRVLYCFAEGARALVAERIRACARSSGIASSVPPIGFVQAPCFTDFNVGSEGFRRLIDHTKPDFAVLDAIGYFGGGFDENSAVEWKAKMMVPLRQLTQEFGTTWLLIHHQVKENPDRKGWQKGRGTSAMFADVDYWLRLEGVEGEGNESKRILHVDKNKHGASGQKIHLVFDKQGAFFRWAVSALEANELTKE